MGLKDRREKTASMDRVSYKVYEVNNVLLLSVYVHENHNSEMDSRIKNVIIRILELALSQAHCNGILEPKVFIVLWGF